MLKKTITYTDYNGNPRTEDFWFHLSKAEILETEMRTEGGLEEEVRRIISTQNQAKLIEIFKNLIYLAYGEKSLDGRRFIKSKEVKDNFTETEAYSILFIELATDADAATKFIHGIIPDDLIEAMETADTNNVVPLPGLAPVDGVNTPK